MSKIKLIAIDLDGTLLKDDKSVCTYSYDALKRINKSGVPVVISTVRAFSGSRELFETLDFNGPLICSCGADIYHSLEKGRDITFTIPMKTALRISEFAEANDLNMGITHGDFSYWKRDPKFGDKQLPFMKFVDDYCKALFAEPLRILAVDSRDKLMSFYGFVSKELAAECNTEINHNPDGRPGSVAVVSGNTGKGPALEYICRKYSVGLSEVMAIGDSFADKSMLDIAGYPVIMGNAVQLLKECGYIETDTNENCGVGKIVEKYF